jgi:hypothetical protein
MASASAKMPRRLVILGFLNLAVGRPDFLTTNAHTSERHFLVQQFCESSVTPHLALAGSGLEWGSR